MTLNDFIKGGFKKQYVGVRCSRCGVIVAKADSECGHCGVWFA